MSILLCRNLQLKNFEQRQRTVVPAIYGSEPLRPFSEKGAERLWVPSPLAPFVMATVHPSSLLRAPDDETRRREIHRFVADLKLIHEVLKKTKGRMRSMKGKLEVPQDREGALLDIDGRQVKLTNLKKIFWPNEGFTKSDLLQYYADVSPVLLPHLQDRAMVMKRYPHGINGEFFFMKRTPSPKPEWLQTCSIKHASGNIIAFPVIQDLSALLWVVNLGCIDLNQWYARCDDIDRPDYLHFDLDPVEGANFEKVCETALAVHAALDSLKIPNYAKTSGSKGIHVYVPIVRGPLQKEVWTFAKSFSRELVAQYPKLITAEYRVAKRPHGHVLVDYNQNAWGRTLASVYSVRPKPRAPVSTPVTWEEIEKGIGIDDFRMDNIRERIAALGDLWKPMVTKRGRFEFSKVAA